MPTNVNIVLPDESYNKLVKLKELLNLKNLAEARQFIDCSFGSYGVGLLDGIIITVLTLAVAFYLRSTTNR